MYFGSVFSPSVTTITRGLSGRLALPRENLTVGTLIVAERRGEVADHWCAADAAFPIHALDVVA